MYVDDKVVVYCRVCTPISPTRPSTSPHPHHIQALQGAASADGQLAQHIARLRESLQDAAQEAAAFAEQQRQDVLRLKGASASTVADQDGDAAQVNGVEGGTKRTREDGPEDMQVCDVLQGTMQVVAWHPWFLCGIHTRIHSFAHEYSNEIKQ